MAVSRSSKHSSESQPKKAIKTLLGQLNKRIVLTTYPGQSVANPIPLNWGAATASERGPVIVSRHDETLKRRNAIGAHGGSYSFYNALAIAAGDLPFGFRPDFANTQPTFDFPYQPAWGDATKIVSMDPFGHDIVKHYGQHLEDGLDVRPTIAVTRATMRVAEIVDSMRLGRLKADGSIVLNEASDVRVTKVAVEPVWYLPGVADRFGVDEVVLRRALVEHTGGSYPELIARTDIKVFLPDILQWLGIKKIDRMLFMSNMKHDAIVAQGIPILERIPIPDEMIPADSRVEIDAKINAGYFTTGEAVTVDALKEVEGRGWAGWEDAAH
ncbi:hypothetical protein FGADI_13105 [Fusarium gaditjirri]|uniref:GTP cyclohydrolase N-terminal domain-containing protein n=1 Tax=Fusarium gaditjirri TaxID=282569 RepID=A0A8H4SQE8_9HYPO|nr:hypothetical protein FGADI_13105 [Fusarium gaditjirri]